MKKGGLTVSSQKLGTIVTEVAGKGKCPGSDEAQNPIETGPLLPYATFIVYATFKEGER
jgi:hypothetical protein